MRRIKDVGITECVKSVTRFSPDIKKTERIFITAITVDIL